MTPADSVLLRTECILQDDSRLMAGVSAVILDAARRAQLSESAQGSLVDAALRVCRASFDVLEKSGETAPKIQLMTTDFPDRVEVAIDYAGEMAPDFDISANDAIGARSEISGNQAKSRSPNDAADRVNREVRDGHACVTLTKFSPSPDSRAGEAGK